MAARVWMNGGANAARLTRRSILPIHAKKCGGRVKTRRSRGPGGARARSQEHAAPLTRRQLVTEAPTGAPLPHACEGKGNEGAASAPDKCRGRWRTPVRWRCVAALFEM